MTKRKSEKIVDDTLENKYLAPADHLATILADKDATVAAIEAERDAAKLQAFRLQAAMQAQQAEAALAEVRARASALAEARKALAADLAVRYALSWDTHALEPLTGRLVPTIIDKD